MQHDIASIRQTYSQKSLNEADVAENPIDQFDSWWTEATNSNLDEVNAMTLATCSADALPSARIVLLKGFSKEGFLFFTNYESYKGRQLEENPRAALVFFWKELERQVRITGLVRRVSREESAAYFHSRPFGSQVGAVTSPQSRIVDSREWLQERYDALESDLEGKEVPLPDYWGGYIVMPVLIEFWQGRPSRLHDRIEYSLDDKGGWKKVRLAP